jgi:putative sterol carrier protein
MSTDQRRQELAALIEGRTDDEIVKGVQAMGVESVFDPIFDGMREAFMPDKAGDRTAIIQYDVGLGDAVHTWQLKVKDGACTPSKGAPDKASVVIAVQLPDFLRLVSGKLNGVQAFFTGKIKLTGDIMLAQTMQAWFLKPGG